MIATLTESVSPDSTNTDRAGFARRARVNPTPPASPFGIHAPSQEQPVWPPTTSSANEAAAVAQPPVSQTRNRARPADPRRGGLPPCSTVRPWPRITPLWDALGDEGTQVVQQARAPPTGRRPPGCSRTGSRVAWMLRCCPCLRPGVVTTATTKEHRRDTIMVRRADPCRQRPRDVDSFLPDRWDSSPRSTFERFGPMRYGSGTGRPARGGPTACRAPTPPPGGRVCDPFVQVEMGADDLDALHADFDRPGRPRPRPSTRPRLRAPDASCAIRDGLTIEYAEGERGHDNPQASTTHS